MQMVTMTLSLSAAGAHYTVKWKRTEFVPIGRMTGKTHLS